MTPVSQTLYSTLLFFALSALLLWSSRRHRGSRRFREGIANTLAGQSGESPIHKPRA